MAKCAVEEGQPLLDRRLPVVALPLSRDGVATPRARRGWRVKFALDSQSGWKTICPELGSPVRPDADYVRVALACPAVMSGSARLREILPIATMGVTSFAAVSRSVVQAAVARDFVWDSTSARGA